ncbi:MAG: hypothetical protein R3A52_29810 [Polyangiales bacterium]
MRVAAALLLALAASSGCATSPRPSPPSRPEPRSLSARLLLHVDEGVRDRALVAREAARLPDGPLFVRVLPALAYANLARRGSLSRDVVVARLAPLLDALLRETSRRVGVGDLARLDQLRGHGTWVGELALVLGLWRLVGGDDRYDALRTRLAAALADALDASGGAPIRSYPSLRWSFDTVPALLALRLHDVSRGTRDHDARIDRALAWMDAHLDPATGLPGSRMALDGDAFTDRPRGSDLGLRIALLAQLDPARARAMYARFVEHFGRSVMGVPAFAEWPEGLVREPDGDSGPVVMGVGVAATGFGLAAARATGDASRARSLRGAISQLPAFLAALGRPVDPRWVTGSLTGDAAVLFGLTWTDWGVAR